jgi:peptidoglycan/LPS O-acetylase OafA/YrhL
VFALVAVMGLDALSPSIVAVVFTYVISLIVTKYFEAPLDRRRKRLTAGLLKTAEVTQEKANSTPVLITAALFGFLSVSAGYNLYKIYFSIALV